MKIIKYNENIYYKIGKNCNENWELLSEDNDFMWFHLASFPSCYVICCHSELNEEMIKFGAELCKENTKVR